MDSETLRARLQAYRIRHLRNNHHTYRNFIGAAINKLAIYGIHIRDIHDGVINYILGILNTQKRFKSIGDSNYVGSPDYSIGKGKIKNLDIAFGSPLHTFLKRSISPLGNLHSNTQASDFEGLPVSPTSLKLLLKKAKYQMFYDRSAMYNCWEWNNTGCVGREHIEFLNSKRWKFIDIDNIIKSKYEEYWMLSEDDIHTEATSILNDNIPLSILQRIQNNCGPVFVATDGSYKVIEINNSFNTQHFTTGAAVLCQITIHEGETFEQELWTNRPAIPILARFSKLPTKIGCSDSDIGHGEGIGGCLGLEMIDRKLPKILIMDSNSVRSTMQALRDRDTDLNPDRRFIRKTISGISKNICSHMERCFSEITDSRSKEVTSIVEEQPICLMHG